MPFFMNFFFSPEHLKVPAKRKFFPINGKYVNNGVIFLVLYTYSEKKNMRTVVESIVPRLCSEFKTSKVHDL